MRGVRNVVCVVAVHSSAVSYAPPSGRISALATAGWIWAENQASPHASPNQAERPPAATRGYQFSCSSGPLPPTVAARKPAQLQPLSMPEEGLEPGHAGVIPLLVRRFPHEHRDFMPSTGPGGHAGGPGLSAEASGRPYPEDRRRQAACQLHRFSLLAVRPVECSVTSLRSIARRPRAIRFCAARAGSSTSTAHASRSASWQAISASRQGVP
jgi:hypothetical protein